MSLNNNNFLLSGQYIANYFNKIVQVTFCKRQFDLFQFHNNGSLARHLGLAFRLLLLAAAAAVWFCWGPRDDWPLAIRWNKCLQFRVLTALSVGDIIKAASQFMNCKSFERQMRRLCENGSANYIKVLLLLSP